MIEYQDIENVVMETGNMGGIAQEVYFAPQSDFASFATVPSEEGSRDFDTMNILEGVDTLKAGKKLYKIYGTMQKGSLIAERQGEVDGVSHKISLKFFTPGLESRSLSLLMIPNQNWIFYVRTGKKMFRVGGEQFASKMAPEGSVGTGDTTAALKGNELVFNTYELGFAPEVASENIDTILSYVNQVDSGLTVNYDPAHGATGVLVDDDPSITFGEAIVDALTNDSFTSQSFSDIVELNQLDVDGNVVAAKPFNGVLAGNVFTVSPTTNFLAATIYELRFNASRVVSADAKGRINGSNYVRFTTA